MEPIVGETLGPCVLLDTNIWREESILRTPLGVAVLYSIRQRGGTLGLPEIIEREARKQCLEAVLEATERIEKSRRLINRFLNNPPSTFSSSQPPRSPNTRRINEAFDNRLKELDPILARIPFSNEQALRALDRVDERRPPAARKAEFKDCAIWEAALDLAEQYAVYLVTRDGSFYDGDDLARGLRQECQERDIKVQAFRSLQDLLRVLAPVAPAVDASEIEKVITPLVNEAAEEHIAKVGGISLGDLAQYSQKIYAIEDPDRVAVAFECEYLVFSSSPNDVDNTPVESRMTIKGTCAFNVAAREISDFNPRSVEIVERSPDGTLRSSSTRTLPTGEGVQRLVIFGPAIVSTDAGTEFRIES